MPNAQTQTQLTGNRIETVLKENHKMKNTNEGRKKRRIQTRKEEDEEKMKEEEEEDSQATLHLMSPVKKHEEVEEEEEEGMEWRTNGWKFGVCAHCEVRPSFDFAFCYECSQTGDKSISGCGRRRRR